MDGITHAMTGVLIGSAGANYKKILYPAILTGVLGSLLIDADSLLRWVMDMKAFWKYHRVYTHNVFAIPILALISSIPAWIWVRGKYLRFYVIALVAVIVHNAMDIVCIWPHKLLFPLSDKDFSLSWVKSDTCIPVLVAVILLAPVSIYIRDRMFARQAEKEEPI
jgi:inner membrane protein